MRKQKRQMCVRRMLLFFLACVLICAALGNRFYGLIILVTVFFAGLIQIHYVKRVERYNETGK